MNFKQWTINVTLIVKKNSDGIPPTMAELQKLMQDHGFEMAMPRNTGDPFVLLEVNNQ